MDTGEILVPIAHYNLPGALLTPPGSDGLERLTCVEYMSDLDRACNLKALTLS